jgi:hypothetical protein
MDQQQQDEAQAQEQQTHPQELGDDAQHSSSMPQQPHDDIYNAPAEAEKDPDSQQHETEPVEYAALYGTGSAEDTNDMDTGTSTHGDHAQPNHPPSQAQPQHSDSDGHVAEESVPPLSQQQQQQQQQQGKFRVVFGNNAPSPAAASTNKKPFKLCSVLGCDKQAQTTHEGMCKRHWKLKSFQPDPARPDSPTEGPHWKSVYESVLPQSIAFRPMAAAKAQDAIPNNSANSSQPAEEGGHDPLDPPPGTYEHDQTAPNTCINHVFTHLHLIVSHSFRYCSSPRCHCHAVGGLFARRNQQTLWMASQ